MDQRPQHKKTETLNLKEIKVGKRLEHRKILSEQSTINSKEKGDTKPDFIYIDILPERFTRTVVAQSL